MNTKMPSSDSQLSTLSMFIHFIGGYNTSSSLVAHYSLCALFILQVCLRLMTYLWRKENWRELDKFSYF